MKVTIIGTDFSLEALHPLSKRIHHIAACLKSLGIETQIISAQNSNISTGVQTYSGKYLFNFEDSLNIRITKIDNVLHKIKMDLDTGINHILFVATSNFLFSTYISMKIRHYNLYAVLDEVEDLYGQLWQQVKTSKRIYKPGYLYHTLVKIYQIFATRLFIWNSYKLILAITPELMSKISKNSKTNTMYLPLIYSKSSNILLNPTVTSQSNQKLKYFAHCGSNDIVKDGIDVLIEGFAIFSENNPEFTLMIIGNNPKYLMQKLKLQIEKLKISDRVVFTGILDENNMQEKIKNATALIVSKSNNPLNKYNFPTKLLDYLLSKNPIILPDFGIYKKYFEDGINAYFFKNGEKESLSKTMRRLVEDPNSNKVGLNGYNLIDKYFNADNYIKPIITKIEVDLGNFS